MAENKDLWIDDGHCIACGKHNPIGMKLEFHVDGERLWTEWSSDKRFQGYADVLHGGMIALVLDETMVNLPWKTLGRPVVSAEMKIRFVRPAKVGERLRFSAWAETRGKRLWLVRGEAHGQDGSLVAESSAKCVPVTLTPSV